MMKLLISLTALLAITCQALGDFGGCDDCIASTSVFFGHLTQPRGVAFQVSILTTFVCVAKPTREERLACDEGVKFHWAGINHVLYKQEVVPDFCSQATQQNCTSSLVPPTIKDNPIEECDDCINEIDEYGSVYIYPEDDFALEYFLKHDGYCEDPALGLGPRQVTECQEFLTGFITPAMQALYNAYVANAQNICHLWYHHCPGE